MSDRLFPLRDFARFLLFEFCDGIGAADEDDGDGWMSDDTPPTAACTGNEVDFLEASLERTRLDFMGGTCCAVLLPHIRHSYITRSLLIGASRARPPPGCSKRKTMELASFCALGGFEDLRFRLWLRDVCTWLFQPGIVIVPHAAQACRVVVSERAIPRSDDSLNSLVIR